jgi:hypothetical protein
MVRDIDLVGAVGHQLPAFSFADALTHDEDGQLFAELIGELAADAKELQGHTRPSTALGHLAADQYALWVSHG